MRSSCNSRYAACRATATNNHIVHLASPANPPPPYPLQAYGGAVSEIPSNATAFFFRNATTVAQYAAYTPPHLEGSAAAVAAQAMIQDLHDELDPFATGSYVN